MVDRPLVATTTVTTRDMDWLGLVESVRGAMLLPIEQADALAWALINDRERIAN